MTINKSFWASNDTLAVKAWHEKLYRETILESYFGKFMGKDGSSPVHVKDEVSKGPGDQITFGIRMKLTGAGQESADSDFTLEGNEESLVTHSDAVTLKEIGHAVKGRNPMSQQRVFFSIDSEAEAAIKDWGVEKLDSQIFDAIYASAFTKEFFASTATSAATLTTAMKITPALLMKAKAWAMTGGGRAQSPIRPIRVKGKMYYVVVLHPYQIYDLKQDAQFQQWMREAEVRGSENPLFTGAVGMCDGMVIHDHERISKLTTGGSGSNVPYGRGFLLGAQAVALAWGHNKMKIESEETDYKRFKSYGITWINGVKKIIFNSRDYGIVGITSALTNLDA